MSGMSAAERVEHERLEEYKYRLSCQIETHKLKLQDFAERDRHHKQKELEIHKENLQFRLERYKARQELRKLRLQGAIQYGNYAINVLMVVNGGIVIALIGFMGNIWNEVGANNRSGVLVQGLTWASMHFGYAVIFSLLTSVMSYVVMVRLVDKPEGAIASKLRYLVPLLALVALVFFGRGVQCSARAFKHASEARIGQPIAACPAPGPLHVLQPSI